jgi:hypothetical protein
VNSVVYRLLRGYLLRSVWLYAVVGVMQFLLTEFYWTEATPRVSTPAALLSLWGIAAAINAYSLVWRSLPLNRRDASLFRWWAIAGAPGLWIAVCDSLAWASQRTSPGLAAPPAGALLQSMLIGWAAVGLLAAWPSLRGTIRGRTTVRIVTALVVAYAAWLFYGVPTYSASPTAFVAFTSMGLGLLVFSGVDAARGKLWRWPDLVTDRPRRKRRGAEGSSGLRFGVSAILQPLLKQTAVFALAATCGVVGLHQLIPGASAWLLLCYFIVISMAGFQLTYQVRSAVPVLRILPLSARQLALGLQLFGALPGIATLVLTLLVNIIVLHVKLNLMEFATFGLIVVASQALPIVESPTPRIRGALLKWFGWLQRLWLPLYIGIVVLSSGGLWAKWWWFKWPLIAAGVVLCAVGYYTLVRQLRAGVRRAGNEGAFSAR